MWMKTICVKFPDIDIIKMDILVREGYFVSRSELIRYAVRMLFRTYDDVIRRALEKRGVRHLGLKVGGCGAGNGE